MIEVANRLDYEWAKQWILDPRKFDPKSKMTVSGLTAQQVESVAMFLWKCSAESATTASAGAH